MVGDRERSIWSSTWRPPRRSVWRFRSPSSCRPRRSFS